MIIRFINLLFCIIIAYSSLSVLNAQGFWQNTNCQNTKTINSIVINSTDHIFIGTAGQGVYRSTDDGNTWNQINNGLNSLQVNTLAIKSNGYLFAGTNVGAFRSTNNGNNWELIFSETNKVSSIAFNTNNHIFIGTTGQGVYCSTNNGNSWIQINSGIVGLSITSLVINSSGHIFAGAWGKGISRSTDNGNTWISVDPQISDPWVYCLSFNAVGHIFSGIIYSSTNTGGIYRSINNGNGFSKIGLNEISVAAIAINQIGYIFAGSTGYGGKGFGVFNSTDNGSNWTKINSGLTDSLVYSLAINSGGYIFAGTQKGAVYRSIRSTTGEYKILLTSPNGGENWIVGSVRNITWSQAGVTNVKIDYTTNNGTTWNNLIPSTPANAGSYPWTIPNTPSTLCKVKISNASDSSLTDKSDNVFTISNPPVITWQNVVTVKDNNNHNQNLTFGLAPTATPGLDTILGESELPPPPPTGIFDARFLLPVSPLISSLKDFRNDTLKQATWTTQFQPSDNNYPITFKWERLSLPEGSFTLKDAVTGTIVNVNMKTDSQFVLTNTGISQLKIEYSHLSSVTFSVNQSWNLVSVPFLASNMAKSSLFPTATSNAFAYDYGYIQEDPLKNLKGYWLNFDSAQNITITGTIVAGNIPVKAGWNIIGPKHYEVAVSAITSIPPGIIVSNFFGYDSGYSPTSILMPGKGYWVRVSADGWLVLPNQTFSKENTEPKNEFRNLSNIQIIDAFGNTRVLSLGEPYEGGELLPPPPPDGIFDCRFSTDKLMGTLNSDNEIKINSAIYPIKIFAVNCEIRLRDVIDGKIIDKTLKSGEEIVISNSQINRLKLTSNTIPLQYSLFQNFPNPFNPNTIINYEIPKSNLVKLKIYDVLGNEIKTLVNEQKEPGSYKAEFNASGYASGIYYYELQSGGFRAVKKMMLVK